MDEYLVCTVEDNGIGRENARAKQASDGKAYRSRGTQLVDKRKKILNQYEYNIEIDSEDVHPNEINTGTRVTIKIGYKK